MALVYIDEDAVQIAQAAVKSLHEHTNQECLRHRRLHAHVQSTVVNGAANALATFVPTTIGQVWENWGLGGVAGECSTSRNETAALHTTADHTVRALLDAHRGVLEAPIGEHAAGIGSAFRDALDGMWTIGSLLTPEALWDLLLHPWSLIDRFEFIEGSLGRATSALDNFLGFLNRLEQDAEHVIEEILRHFPGLDTAYSPPPVAHHGATKTATSAPGFATQIVSTAGQLAGQLQGAQKNSYIASDGSNVYPGDKQLAEEVIKVGGDPWSWSDIECVAFVWLVYAQHMPNWRQKLIGGDADQWWDNYGTQHAKDLGWQRIPNGQSPQPGDILVQRTTDVHGNLMYGHVAIVQDVEQLPPSHDGHTHAILHIYQANSGASTSLTMTDGAVDARNWTDSNGVYHHVVTQGYIRYSPSRS